MSAEKIIVALDKLEEQKALELAVTLSGKVWGFKVNDLLLRSGTSIVTKLKAYGSVFADPKLHDIPNTVSNAVTALSEAGADLITLHSSGGKKMIQAAVAAAGGQAKILCVTALTSLSAADTERIYQRSPAETVLSFARLAAESGADGIVCSGQELELFPLEEQLEQLMKVVPGIRPASTETQDQQRVSTPESALRAGATFLVVGRPITQAADPTKAVEEMFTSA